MLSSSLYRSSPEGENLYQVRISSNLLPLRRPLLVVLGVLLTFHVLAGDALAQQPVDEEYTAKILEFTTEDFFMTPHVDHLPASETVPTPLDVLGHIAGAANVLSYPEEIYRYMRAVADASPRVEVHTIGRTEEGRELIVVVVSSEENIRNLERHKADISKLGDPRITTQAEAERLISTTVPMYWATVAIHSPETGSPEMLMELVYRLAVEDTEFVWDIRDNLIFLATPVIEVDGRAKVVDLHMGPRKDPDANLPTRPLYWGEYVAHDNNRDGMGLSLALSRSVVKTFLEYRPLVFHDLHESASHLYTSTGRGPYNAWVDPIVINEWNRLAYKEVEEMTALGVPGVYTHDFYDGWAPNYMMFVAHLHNGMGRFYETQGAGSGETRVITTQVQREWHRPNTPLSEVVWSIRNNVNLQQSAILIALNEVADNREEFVSNFWRKSLRSVAKATAEGPAAYVFPADDPRPGQQARLLSLLQQHGFEIHRADDDFTVGEAEYAEGSYVVRMDQPFSRGADMMLDKQYYNPNDPRPYDDVGWTHGPLYNVLSDRVEDTSILDVPMTLAEATIRASGGVEGDRSPGYYLINYNADNNLTAFRFANPDISIEAAESGFTADDRDFNAGSFIIRTEENERLRRAIEMAAREHGDAGYDHIRTTTPSLFRKFLMLATVRSPSWKTDAARTASAPEWKAAATSSTVPMPPEAMTGTVTASCMVRSNSRSQPLRVPSRSQLVSRISPAPSRVPSWAHAMASIPVASRPPITSLSQLAPSRRASMAKTTHWHPNAWARRPIRAGSRTAAVFTLTLSAPADRSARASSTVRTPPPTVSGMCRPLRTERTVSSWVPCASGEAAMSSTTISSAPCRS